VSRKVTGHLFASVAALALVTAAPAAAQSPTQDAYGGILPGVQTTPATPPPASGTLPSEETSPPAEEPAPTETEPPAEEPTAVAPEEVQHGAAAGDLPFTGLELGVVTMAGLLMLGAGIAVRRAARSTP
jgi:hypothetical protein